MRRILELPPLHVFRALEAPSSPFLLQLPLHYSTYHPPPIPPALAPLGAQTHSASTLNPNTYQFSARESPRIRMPACCRPSCVHMRDSRSQRAALRSLRRSVAGVADGWDGVNSAEVPPVSRRHGAQVPVLPSRNVQQRAGVSDAHHSSPPAHIAVFPSRNGKRELKCAKCVENEAKYGKVGFLLCFPSQ